MTTRDKTKCRYCGEMYPGGKTIGCANCWEVGSRIRSMSLEILQKIFATERPDWKVEEK